MNASVATRPSVSASTSPLAGTRFELTIRDLVAEFTVSQRYVNDESRPIEAIFTFPMAMDATFLGLTARIGERTLTGTIAPRQARRHEGIGQLPARLKMPADRLRAAVAKRLSLLSC